MDNVDAVEVSQPSIRSGVEWRWLTAEWIRSLSTSCYPTPRNGSSIRLPTVETDRLSDPPRESYHSGGGWFHQSKWKAVFPLREEIHAWQQRFKSTLNREMSNSRRHSP